MINKAQVEGLVDEAVKKIRKLDIRVNNAGIMDDFSDVGDINDELWDKVFKVNVEAPMIEMRRQLIHFRARKGRYLNISSAGEMFGCRDGAAYTASQHAVAGLTKNIMYTKKNIRCNAICPGAFETEIAITESMKYINTDGMAIAMSGMELNPRTGRGSEIAETAVFLVSDNASFLTGKLNYRWRKQMNE